MVQHGALCWKDRRTPDRKLDQAHPPCTTVLLAPGPIPDIPPSQHNRASYACALCWLCCLSTQTRPLLARSSNPAEYIFASFVLWPHFWAVYDGHSMSPTAAKYPVSHPPPLLSAFSFSARSHAAAAALRFAGSVRLHPKEAWDEPDWGSRSRAERATRQNISHSR